MGCSLTMRLSQSPLECQSRGNGENFPRTEVLYGYYSSRTASTDVVDPYIRKRVLPR